MINAHSNHLKVDLFLFILIYDMPGFLSRGQVQIRISRPNLAYRTNQIQQITQDNPGHAPPPAAPPASTLRLKNPPGEWTKRHADIIFMLSRGHSCNGTVRKVLIDEIKLNLPGVKNHKHKASIMQGKMPELKRQDTQGKKLGRPFKMTREDFRARIPAVAFHKRKTLGVSHATDIPRSTLHGYLQRGILLRRQSSIKPFLTEANRLHRFNWTKSFVESDGKFCDVMGRIMMDEKWFHIQMPKRRCFILK
jgi:hypothetical protein